MQDTTLIAEACPVKTIPSQLSELLPAGSEDRIMDMVKAAEGRQQMHETIEDIVDFIDKSANKKRS